MIFYKNKYNLGTIVGAMRSKQEITSGSLKIKRVLWEKYGLALRK